MKAFLSRPKVIAKLQDCPNSAPDAQAFLNLPLFDLWESLGWTDVLDEVTQSGKTVKSIMMPKVIKKLERLWGESAQGVRLDGPIDEEPRVAKKKDKPTRFPVSLSQGRKATKSFSPHLRPRSRASIGKSDVFKPRLLRNSNIISTSMKDLEAAIAAIRFLMSTAASRKGSPVKLDFGKGLQYKQQVHIHFPSKTVLPALGAALHSSPRLLPQLTEPKPHLGGSEQASGFKNMDSTTTAAPATPQSYPTSALPLLRETPKDHRPAEARPGSPQAKEDTHHSVTATLPTSNQSKVKGARVPSNLGSAQGSHIEGPLVSLKRRSGVRAASPSAPRIRSEKQTIDPGPTAPRQLRKFLRAFILAILLCSLGLLILCGVYYASITLPVEYRMTVGSFFLAISFIPLDRVRKKLRIMAGRLRYFPVMKVLTFATGLAFLRNWFQPMLSSSLSIFDSVITWFSNDSESNPRVRHGPEWTPPTDPSTNIWLGWLMPLFCCLILGCAFVAIYWMALGTWFRIRSTWRWTAQSLGLEPTE